MEGIGVGLDIELIQRGFYLVLVEVARSDARYEQLPNPGTSQHAHLVDPPVPLVEAAHHADPFGRRRPNRKGSPPDAVYLARVAAQLFIDPVMVALAEKKCIIIRHGGKEGIGIISGIDHPFSSGMNERVGEHVPGISGQLVKTPVVNPFHGIQAAVM